MIGGTVKNLSLLEFSMFLLSGGFASARFLAVPQYSPSKSAGPLLLQDLLVLRNVGGAVSDEQSSFL